MLSIDLVASDAGTGLAYCGSNYQAWPARLPSPRRGKDDLPADEAIRPGYLKYGVGSHFIYYRQFDAETVVIRILHQRMDVGRHI
ncbi:hypothetical protein GCM10007874_55820 [Labrys miyagiensis]|uniref:Toxin ParE1/3/4 n=1 Tax=Labrys miyagiensis TaxID=346912 RepID=A0ABQ6CS59_9HYPH|nr:type II toxin-antitoxin system RelE/ParE family toxin [Labrys miyagiensis]GLS22564.1 hypothetical protein GCM10007874_55820 [Labrys miyagiensis]